MASIPPSQKKTDKLPDIEPPRPSPRPPSVFDEPRHDTGEMPVTRAVFQKALRLNEMWTVLVAIVAAGGALIGGYTIFISRAEAAGEKAAAKVAERQDKVEESQKEVREDMRAIYRAVMYRQPQERLEKPAPVKDGGP